MKKLLLTALLASSTIVSAQQYLTREARLSFDAGSPLEDIEAFTESGSAVFDASSGKIGVQVLMTSFQFKRALMQEHFNENYVESEKFPKASFKGTYNEGKVTGELSIHGVTKEISVPATLREENENFVLTTAFDIILAEYNVEIPSAVADKISKAASIQVQATLKSVGK
ncbi:YceI family protein [Schleiferiaceae bacterium]|jgi:polyisoprenoid-binding protein YceI|nr:YceI family protein [Schleiferiaceae bacterium]